MESPDEMFDDWCRSIATRYDFFTHDTNNERALIFNKPDGYCGFTTSPVSGMVYLYVKGPERSLRYCVTMNGSGCALTYNSNTQTKEFRTIEELVNYCRKETANRASVKRDYDMIRKVEAAQQAAAEAREMERIFQGLHLGARARGERTETQPRIQRSRRPAVRGASTWADEREGGSGEAPRALDTTRRKPSVARTHGTESDESEDETRGVGVTSTRKPGVHGELKPSRYSSSRCHPSHPAPATYKRYELHEEQQQEEAEDEEEEEEDPWDSHERVRSRSKPSVHRELMPPRLVSGPMPRERNQCDSPVLVPGPMTGSYRKPSVHRKPPSLAAGPGVPLVRGKKIRCDSPVPVSYTDAIAVSYREPPSGPVYSAPSRRDRREIGPGRPSVPALYVGDDSQERGTATGHREVSNLYFDPSYGMPLRRGNANPGLW